MKAFAPIACVSAMNCLASAFKTLLTGILRREVSVLDSQPLLPQLPVKTLTAPYFQCSNDECRMTNEGIIIL